jgi:hypothetical protein
VGLIANQQVSAAEMERIMKVQKVILKAMAGTLKWWEAAEIIGVSDQTMRRWRERYQEHGYDGLYDYRKNRPSPKRIPVETSEKVLHRKWRIVTARPRTSNFSPGIRNCIPPDGGGSASPVGVCGVAGATARLILTPDLARVISQAGKRRFSL